MSILWLDEIRARDRARVGGKAANLGELLGQEFPVPPGFVVCAEAYAELLGTLGLGAILDQLRTAPPDQVESLCSRIRSGIEDTDLPEALADGILAAHRRLLAGRATTLQCAVRSSATAEDLGAASFAGQHGTYYYVDADHLLQRVRQCWASLWTAQAVCYRASHGIDLASVWMAVVVQEMIPSDVSGVTFTVNPVTGNRDELIVEASWGMGAALVDGRVTPDRFVLRRGGLVLQEQRIASKRLMVASRLEAGQQARLQEVPHERRSSETLTTEQQRVVAEWALRSETHFGTPQDVEWALCDGRFWLLQSRPVTVMGREDVGRGIEGRWVLFKPLVENFTDPLTPLSADMFGTARTPGMRMIRGWLYLDVALIERLLPFDAPGEQLAEHIYSLSRDRPDWKLSYSKLPLILLGGLASTLAFAVVLVRTSSLPDSALAGCRELCRRLEEDDTVSPEQALRRIWLLPRFLAPVAHLPLFVNLASGCGFAWMALLRRLLELWVPELRMEAEVLLSSGSEGVLSAEMGRGIQALGATARRTGRVREILLSTPAAQALHELRREPEASGLVRQLDRFLEQNGHRAIKEFELRSPRWEEEPAVVLAMVRNFAVLEQEPVDHERRAAEARERLTPRLRESLAERPLERWLGIRFRVIQAVAERVRYFLKLRENSRFYHIMGPATVRRKVLRIERELMRQGRLKCKDDVFFLTFAELSDLQAGRIGWLEVEDRIRERRIEHIRLCKLGPPKTIGFELEKKPLRSASPGDGLALEGQSASPGLHEGRARVILDPTLDARIQPGEVLVAPYTDPAWTPLFLTAGAAVVEIGSYLSHAGTVAREFGMPCVVDVAEATHRIRTGDRLAVDGDTGRVTVLPAGEPR